MLSNRIKKLVLESKKDIFENILNNNSTEDIAYLIYRFFITSNFLVKNNFLSEDFKRDYESLFSDFSDKKNILHRFYNGLKNKFFFMFKDIDYIFEHISDCLLNNESKLYNLLFRNNDIWNDVEIIGWLYQFYNAEIKKNILNQKRTVKDDEIKYVTQFFTPKWIVQYMVQNTLGKLILERDESISELSKNWHYFIKEDFKTLNDKTFSIEKLKIIDPAFGTGHIICYLYDFLEQIYKFYDYNISSIPIYILDNLYFMDIDNYSSELGLFCLNLKCLRTDENFNNKNFKPNIIVFNDYENFNNLNILGSIFKSNEEDEKVISELKFLNQKYDILITNPPYMGKRYINKILKKYLIKNYKLSQSDLFGAFIEKGFELVKYDGYLAYMTSFVWMFIKSYEKLREDILKNRHLESLIRLEYAGFSDATVPICTFILKNKFQNKKGFYFDLEKIPGKIEQNEKFLKALKNKDFFHSNLSKLLNLSEFPIAFWLDEEVINILNSKKKLEDCCEIKQGMATSNNKKYIRYWWELNKSEINFSVKNLSEDYYSWVPYNKGGDYRKWYGNQLFVINFENNGKEIKEEVIRRYPYLTNPEYVVKNQKYFLKEGITWSFVSSANFGVRYIEKGFIFDVAGSMIFPDKKDLYYLLGLLSSKLSFDLLESINPTMNYQVGDLKKLPIFDSDEQTKSIIENIVKENIDISKQDWDNKEVSWNYTSNPILKYKKDNQNLIDSIKEYKIIKTKNYKKIFENEYKLNVLFSDVYNLNEKIAKKDIENKLTIKKFDEKDELECLISHITGNILGRYEKNKKDFIFLKNDDLKKDDIIIYEKEIETLFGKSDRNINYISKIFSRSGQKSLKNYLIKNFKKSHLIMFHQTPIYWVFTSGKSKYLNFIVYYHEFLKNSEKVLSEIFNLSYKEKEFLLNSTCHENKIIKEIDTFMNKLNLLINNNIELNYKDGIKLNYKKFENII